MMERKGLVSWREDALNVRRGGFFEKYKLKAEKD